MDDTVSRSEGESYQPEDAYSVLQDIARNVQVISRSSFCHPDLNGDDPYQLYLKARTRASRLHWRVSLRWRLTMFLYERYFSGMFFLRRAEESLHSIYGADPALLYALQQANEGCGYFEEGWRVTSLDDPDHLFVSNGSLTLWIRRDVHLRPEQQQARVGDSVAIRWPAGRPFLTPGFYMAFSNRPLKSTRDSIVRFYFHIPSQAATLLMHEVTAHLNEVRVGFRFKICNHPKYYVRRDTAVLYLDRADYPIAREAISTIYENLQDSFSVQIPLFTKFLAPGLALAEDPPQTQEELESFGQHRCRLLAEGLLAAYEASRSDAKSKLDLMIQRFRAEGLKLECPYLNPGSIDIYEWS